MINSSARLVYIAHVVKKRYARYARYAPLIMIMSGIPTVDIYISTCARIDGGQKVLYIVKVNAIRGELGCARQPLF